MDLFIIIGLVLAGIILLLVEVFLVPGLSLAGIGAAGCLIYATSYAFYHIGFGGGIVTLTASLVTSVLVFVWFMRSKSLDRLSLKKEIGSSVKEPSTNMVHVGDKGIALTRLAQIGNADFDGNIIEVRSSGDFIEEKSPIVVERISNGIIIVKQEPKITQ